MFEDGLIHTVAVELADGTHQGARGGSQPQYRAVEGMEAVPCRVVPTGLREAESFAHRGARIDAKILFASGLRLTDRHRLKFAEPGTGRVRVFTVKAGKDWHEQGAGYTALCEEQEN